jgi:GrpB-like predicted nucleotidyltransferase (UPF0157 family)
MPEPAQSSDCAAMTEDELRAVTIGDLQPLNAPIVIAEYDENWPALFKEEAQKIGEAVGDRALRIEHIGSTSVPGLAAKPVIDILLVIADPRAESTYVPHLEAVGYQLRIREPSFFEHRMLKGLSPEVNLHVYPAGCEEIDRYLLLRDWLRTSESDREYYARTKKQLARKRWTYVQNYADAKSEVVEGIITKARNSRLQR